MCLFFTPTWGRFPICRAHIFQMGGSTTNQRRFFGGSPGGSFVPFLHRNGRVSALSILRLGEASEDSYIKDLKVKSPWKGGRCIGTLSRGEMLLWTLWRDFFWYIWFDHAHRIHVWYIVTTTFTIVNHQNQPNVGKYMPYMDSMGCFTLKG